MRGEIIIILAILLLVGCGPASEQVSVEPVAEESSVVEETQPEPEQSAAEVQPVREEKESASSSGYVIEKAKEDIPAIQNKLILNRNTYVLQDRETKLLRFGGKDYKLSFRFFNSDQSMTILINDNERTNLKINESIILDDGIELTITNVFRRTIRPSNDMVWFLLSTPDGAVKDMLYEGESKIYVLNGIDYKLNVMTISEQGRNDPPLVMFKLNSQQSESLREDEEDSFSEDISIFVLDIFDNEGGEQFESDFFQVELSQRK